MGSAAQPDVIVVGAGLSGLVATYELTRAGRHVVVVDQENRANLGGQAFWSLGGLFMVDTPEQRRMGIKDSYELALHDWLGRPRSTASARTIGRGSGPGPTSASPPARSGSTCTTSACASRRSSAGPSAATAGRPGTATRCRAST